MSRVSKPLSMQKGHLTVEQQLIKEQKEQLIAVGKSDLENAPAWLINDTARAEFARLVREFEKIDIIGNLDVNNLGAYCNAYAFYLNATEQLRDEDLIVIKPLPNGSKQRIENPLIKIQKSYADEMRKFGAKVGLDITSRLKSAGEKISQEDNQVNDEFGDI